jgi:phage gpG-like protein
MAIGAKGAIQQMKGDSFERMVKAVNIARNETLVTLSGNRSGRTYKVPGTSRTYTASAPGEAPAQATGQLRQSVKTSVDIEGSKIIGIVGSDLPYARRLEFGYNETDSAGRHYNMAARPWLRVSCEKATPDILKALGGL